MTCDHPEVRKYRDSMWSLVEMHLLNAVRPKNGVCSHTQPCCPCFRIWQIRGLSSRRPGDWVVEASIRDRWPLISWLGWMVPINGEDELQGDRQQEGPYDLGYRAVIPKCIAQQVYSDSLPPGSSKADDIQANAVQITISIAVLMGRIRRLIANQIRKEFPKIASAKGTKPKLVKNKRIKGIINVTGKPRSCEGELCKGREHRNK